MDKGVGQFAYQKEDAKPQVDGSPGRDFELDKLTHFRTWSGTGKRWVCLLSLPKLRLQHLDDMHPGYTALPRLVVFDAYDPTVATHLDVLSDV